MRAAGLTFVRCLDPGLILTVCRRNRHVSWPEKSERIQKQAKQGSQDSCSLWDYVTLTFNYLKGDYGGKPQPIYVKGRVGVNTMEDWDRTGTKTISSYMLERLVKARRHRKNLGDLYQLELWNSNLQFEYIFERVGRIF